VTLRAPRSAPPALAAALLVLAGCGGGGTAAPAGGDGNTFKVARGPLRITVADTGTLRAKNSVNVKARIPGTARVVWLVAEGTEAKQGDRLAELDKTEVQKNIEQLESQLSQQDSERKTNRTEYDIQKAEGKAAVDKAALTLDIRRSEMQRYTESEAPFNLEKRKLAVERSHSEYLRRKERHSQMEELHKREFVTAAQVEEERIALLAAELDWKDSLEQHESYVKHTADIERREKESALADAERGLANETLRAENLLDRKKVAWEQAERRFETTKQKLDEARKQFEAMTVTAPSPGIVIYNDRPDDELKIGSTVYNDQAFLQLPDLSEMEVVLGIHEADVTKLKVGQKAWVTLDAFKGQRLAAEVLRVGTVASERDWRSDIRKFEVILGLEKNALPLKPGSTVKVEVQVGEVDGVLAVPLQSVFTRDGKYYAFVGAGGRPERREVQLGEANAGFVVVKEGLKEGDEVLLWNPEGTTAAPAADQDRGGPPKKEGSNGGAAPAGRAPSAPSGGAPAGGGGAPRGGRP
jgi:RND family efflux transporter MFP subunit